jgi:hypothetical protein
MTKSSNDAFGGWESQVHAGCRGWQFGYGYPVPDMMGPGTGIIFYLRVTPVPEPRRIWGEYFFSPTVTRRVSNTLLPL